jgi:hypothetical protein
MKIDETKYKIWTWKNPLMLHWIINPGLAINELILGQRIPKITLVEKNQLNHYQIKLIYLVHIVKHYTLDRNGHHKTKLHLEIGLDCIVIIVVKLFLA